MTRGTGVDAAVAQIFAGPERSALVAIRWHRLHRNRPSVTRRRPRLVDGRLGLIVIANHPGSATTHRFVELDDVVRRRTLVAVTVSKTVCELIRPARHHRKASGAALPERRDGGWREFPLQTWGSLHPPARDVERQTWKSLGQNQFRGVPGSLV